MCPAVETRLRMSVVGTQDDTLAAWNLALCPPPDMCHSYVFQVVAVYPFVARSTHELSLQAGQPVTILEAQDKKGNPEWSLVEANGQRGYVPSNFLARTPSPTPWGWNLPS